MFGYVVADLEQLDDNQKEIYRSYYCGLCRSLKNQFGNFGRLTLNYDMAFMVLLLADLYDPDTKVFQGRCLVHPAKERKMSENQLIDYGAAMNLLLAYYNLMDDWEDEGKRRSLTAANRIRRYIPSIEEQYPRQARAVREGLRSLRDIEQRGEKNPDAAANAFGAILGEIFLWKKDRWAEDCYRFGDSLGHFIYWMDAYEDLPKDRKKGNYNPFLLREESPDFEIWMEEILKSALGECALVLERLPLVEHLDILRNVLYSGIWSKYKIIKEKRNESESL